MAGGAEHDEITKNKGDGEALVWDDLAKMKFTWRVLSPAAQRRDHLRAQGPEETQHEVAGEHESLTHEFWCRSSSVF